MRQGVNGIVSTPDDVNHVFRAPRNNLSRTIPSMANNSKGVAGSLIFCQTWESALFYLFLAFVIIGGLNWFLVGVADWNLVTAITAGRQRGPANAASRVIYTLVGAFTIALLIMTIVIAAQRNRC